MNNCCEMTFFGKFAEGDGYPFTFFRDVDLSVFGMFSPGSPFSLKAGVYIVEENASSSCAHWIIVWFVAHHKKFVSALEPSNFLYEGGFDDMLIFFCGFDLLDQFLYTGEFVDCDIVLHDDC